MCPSRGLEPAKERALGKHKKEEAAWDLLMPLAQPDRAVEFLLESVVVKNPLAVFFGQQDAS